ncbi:hypothetical protein [uncultured Roseivirga sp.]|uniref:hypothetical protein n=1 Tax=Roseivirga sp. UBA1976 TaxID=1947386 RepID=UPI002EA5C702|nr:hypothetical protein [Bacteroidota bacterium]
MDRKKDRTLVYDDHRMAMAFAPIMTRQPIIIHNPSVVNKSYPGFWEHVDKIRLEK